ncbi:MAG: S8 family serine peptidase [Betaproteobacteria bacterium]
MAGTYLVSAFDSDLLAPPRQLLIDRNIQGLPLHLGKRGLPYYRMGRALIPFSPASELLAIAFEFDPPDEVSARRAVDTLSKELPIQRYEGDGLPFRRAAGYVWLLSIQPGADRRSVISALRAKLKDFGMTARVGLPIDIDNDHVRVLDNRFVFRAAADTRQIAQQRLEKSLGFRSMRTHKYDSDVWVAESASADTEKILSLINCLVRTGLLITGEPDLFVEFVDHDVPHDSPHDPGYTKQYGSGAQRFGNHSYQRVREAWGLLYDPTGPPMPLIGDGEIYVASLDRGIDQKHHDVSAPGGVGDPRCVARDATRTQQLRVCFDAVRQVFCDSTNTGYIPPPNSEIEHGMAVFGTIAACTDNDYEIAGIAPGTHHIAVRRVLSASPTFYGDTLSWIGGLQVSCPQPDDPRHPCHWPPITNPADIINASHGFTPAQGCTGTSCFDLPTWIDATFQALVTQGGVRNGVARGVVLVYSAGNAGTPVEVHEPLAADTRTIAVANCKAKKDDDVFLAPLDAHAGPSNYGDAIDICALGYDTQTISPLCSSAPCRFGGTSAAAATVSGAIALILSANRDLTWTQVRDVLRSSARKIDPNNGQWKSGRSPFYGSGLLDVCHAVKQALDLKASPGSTLWPNGDPCPAAPY